MLAHPPDAPQSADDHVPLAWPHRLLTRLGDANAVVGFLMPRAPAAAQAIDCYNPQRRLEICSLFDYRYLLRTARNLAAAARTVHARGYVIGDLKHSNVLVSQTALVTLVDTDSFQVRCPQSGRIYPCRVETPDYTPPERQNDPNSAAPLTPEHDLFALGVLIFQLLMEGTHPFAGVYKGECDPPSFEECLAARHFPYGAKPGPYRPGRRTLPRQSAPLLQRPSAILSLVRAARHPAARPGPIPICTARAGTGPAACHARPPPCPCAFACSQSGAEVGPRRIQPDARLGRYGLSGNRWPRFRHRAVPCRFRSHRPPAGHGNHQHHPRCKAALTRFCCGTASAQALHSVLRRYHGDLQRQHAVGHPQTPARSSPARPVRVSQRQVQRHEVFQRRNEYPDYRARQKRRPMEYRPAAVPISAYPRSILSKKGISQGIPRPIPFSH